MIFLILISAILFSCSGSKNTIGNRGPQIIESNKQEDVSPSIVDLEMDTIQWTIVSEEIFEPITSEMAEDVLPFSMERKEYYDVALLMPFRISSLDYAKLDANNEKFAHFYAGFKMAFEDLSNTDLTVRIRTYQTNRDLGTLQNIINRIQGEQPDIIIGPFEKNNLMQVAEVGRENQIPVISPWSASTNVTDDNLFYLQLRPNISAYYKSMLEHMTHHFDRKNIRVISNSKGGDKGMLSFIQNINEEESELPIVQPIEEYPISYDSLLYGDSLVFKTAFEEDANVFFLPHYNTARHDKFVYECLRKINAEKDGREIYVYAMPIALNSERVDLNILKNINLRVCDYRFVDPRSPFTLEFKNSYVSEFGWMPTEDSYYGYDIAKFIEIGLTEYGKYFHYYMKENKIDLFQMSINIVPYHDKDDNFKYLMNNHLQIIQFENDYFTQKSID